MSIPSTPARHGQHNDSDPFSSPARGVCWSPGASTTLLDGLSRGGDVSRPSTDVESILDTNVSPVRRATRLTGFQIRSYGPFTPSTRYLKRNSSSQSHDSFISSDMTRFLASPIHPSSPPSMRSGTLQSPSASPSPGLDISFYGAGLDINEFDRYYQLASPASSGSLLSRSASFYTHLSSRSSNSQGFRPSSPVPAPSTANLSSPMFPPPASPPSFATQLSSQAHTSSQNNHSAPPFPPSAPTSSVSPQSPAIGPSSATLPPSSPLPNGSSPPFESDPFIVDNDLETTRPPARTGTLPILDDDYPLDYELPNIEPSPTSGLSAHRRGRIYSTRTRPVKARASLLDARAGVAKAPRVDSKAPTRGRNGGPNRPVLAGPFTHTGRESASTSPGSYMPYLSPFSSTHTPTPARFLATGLGTRSPNLLPTHNPRANPISASSSDVCATSSVPVPLTPTGFGGSSSSRAVSARFTLPTPAMTASFATPSTASSPATPASTGLLCPHEIVDSYSTPANFMTRPRDVAKRRRFMRHATPSPISVPEYLGMLDNQTAEVGAKPAGQIVRVPVDGEMRTPGKVEPGTEDLVAHDKAVTNVASTNPNDQSPEAAGSVSHFQRSKRAREESTGGDPHVAKRAKENISATSKNEKAKIELETTLMEFALARPTRSQTRAVAALLALSTNTERPEKTKGDDSTSLASSCEQPLALQASSNVRSSRKTRGRPPAPTRGQAGRAPSRVVAQPDNQIAMDSIEASGIETGGASANAPSGHVQEDRAKTEGGEEPKDDDITESDSRNPIALRSERIVPSELLPRPDKATIFGSDGNIKQRTFPKGFPIRAEYERWYRRFPVSAYFPEKDPAKAFVLGFGAPKSVDMQPRAGSGALTSNRANHFNLYTPRFVRGVGTDKFGLCPICVEPVWRGGEGKAVLLNTKISAFNYHMQYYHGICSQTGLPFSPPIAFRHGSRKAAHSHERSKIEQGKCHSCKQWIHIESIKHGDVLVPELHWWKHAASCHGKSRVEGDQNPYLEDAVYLRLREYESRVMSEAGNDQREHPAVSTDQEQASAGAALTTIPVSLDKDSNVGSGSSLPSMDEKKLLENGGILGNIYGTMDSDSDLTDLDDDK